MRATNADRWWIAYANFVTLLLAFFIVLYAISKPEPEKLKQVTSSIRESITGIASGPADPFAKAESTPAEVDAKKWAGEKKSITRSLDKAMAASAGPGEEPPARLETRDEAQGLWISVVARGLFLEGDASLPADMLPLVDRIGRILSRSRRAIRIEGHADPSEASRLTMESRWINAWSLSTARAESVARRWIHQSGVEPARITVAGKGEHHPLSDNDSELARARNRRIEILVLADPVERADE